MLNTSNQPLNVKTGLNIKIFFLIGGMLILIMLIAVIIFKISSQFNSISENPNDFPVNNQNSVTYLSEAQQARMRLSNGKCSGAGPVILSVSPMQPEDFSILIPYGLMVGGHVTPIDHQYFSPTIFNSPRDSYEVMAMADGRIVDIQPRDRVNPQNATDKFQEYRIVFTHTCTFFTYFDLVTSLSPDLLAAYEKVKNPEGYAGSMDFLVKAGQVIGKIGGQTLDFAVWNTEQILSGFIVPEHYQGEFWKIYTANPYDYMTPELKELLIERNPRTVEPIQGKIDYDIPGKLIGNWFVAGSGGYSGGQKAEYWKTHLAIAPDHYDPTKYIISFGDFAGQASQFTVSDSTFRPENIGVESGLLKLELKTFSYVDTGGNSWNGMSLIKSPKLIANNFVQGCVLLQLLEPEKLKVETIPKKNCSGISGFSDQAQIYER